MPGADFGDHVMPSVIPADAGLSIHQGPGAMRRTGGLPGVPISLKRDEESASGAILHLPFADIMRSPRSCRGQSGIRKLDVVDLARDFFTPPVLVNDRCWSFQINTFDFGCREALPMPVFEDNHKRIMVLGGSRPRFYKAYGEQKDSGNCEYSNETAHLRDLRTGGYDSNCPIHLLRNQAGFGSISGPRPR